MNGIYRITALALLVLVSLAGCVHASYGSGVELRPGEAEAEMRFNLGIGEEWTGGDPPSYSGRDSIFSQYYSVYRGPAEKKHIEAPRKGNIEVKTPATVYFSYDMKAMPYSQYQSYAASTGGNWLWIGGSTSWTEYARVPQGAVLSLIAGTSTGGQGDLYEINPSGRLTKNSFYFYPGYNQIGFYADSVGQHILLYVIGGRVSNSIVIDVAGYYQPPYPQPPAASYPSTQVPPAGLTPSVPSLPPATSPSSGDTPATIVSQGMRGYQVFLDGTFIGTEGTGQDPLDGRFSFTVAGGQNHEVRVYDGQFNYIKTMYFERGVQKIVNVEPGTAVYV